jgi:hypothetical protein
MTYPELRGSQPVFRGKLGFASKKGMSTIRHGCRPFQLSIQVFAKGADSMNALILMAVLAGPPECPTIRIAAGGEELVIRKLDSRVDVSILTSPPEDSTIAVIHWGEFFIEFERKATKAERSRFLLATRMTNDMLAMARDRSEARGDTLTEESRKPLESLESTCAKVRTVEKECMSNMYRADVAKEGDKWVVRNRCGLLAEAFVATGTL